LNNAGAGCLAGQMVLSLSCHGSLNKRPGAGTLESSNTLCLDSQAKRTSALSITRVLLKKPLARAEHIYRVALHQQWYGQRASRHIQRQLRRQYTARIMASRPSRSMAGRVLSRMGLKGRSPAATRLMRSSDTSWSTAPFGPHNNSMRHANDSRIGRRRDRLCGHRGQCSCLRDGPRQRWRSFRAHQITDNARSGSTSSLRPACGRVVASHS